MRYVPRLIEPGLARASRHFPGLVLTGPRRAGKITLLRRLFPKAADYLLEDPDVIARVRADPRGFIAEARPPVILDEIQNAPEILRYVRTQIDAAPRRVGRWLLTGSQDAPLMRGVSESLAGRAAVFRLLPMATTESQKVSMLRGGFPEVLARPAAAEVWFRSYVQTYLERDVRAIIAIRELGTFRRFLALVASRCGQILNKTDIAAPLGVSVPTLTQWLGVLEVTGQILLIPPFYESFGKRLIKSPKLYFIDSGLACHLLGIDSVRALERSPFRGAIFEGFVASEIVKEQLGRGRAQEIYYFRDQQGLEVDFVVPGPGRRLALVEAKASATVTPSTAEPLARLAKAAARYETRSYLVYQPRDASAKLGSADVSAVRPGVRAVDLQGLLRALQN